MDDSLIDKPIPLFIQSVKYPDMMVYTSARGDFWTGYSLSVEGVMVQSSEGIEDLYESLEMGKKVITEFKRKHNL